MKNHIDQYESMRSNLTMLLFLCIGFPTFAKVNNVGDDTLTEIYVGSGVYRIQPYNYQPTDFFSDY